MYGSTFLSKLLVALLTLTNAPLWICLSLKSLRIRTDLGSSLLTPRILMTKATLDWAGTWICPLTFAALLAASSVETDFWWSAAYCWTLFNNASLLVLLSALLFSRSSLRVVAIFWFLSYFFLRPSGFGGTFFSACIISTI